MAGFKFPDEDDGGTAAKQDRTEVKVSSVDDDIEVEVIDDTPAQDRGRKPLDYDVADPSDDEIENYSEGVKKRIKELTHARHDERRAKESLLRERQELERMAQAIGAENRQLKHFVNNGSTHYAASVRHIAESEMDAAKRKLKEATESFDTDAVIAAQEEMLEARLRLEAAKNFNPAPLHVDEDVVQPLQNQVVQAPIDDKTLRWQAKNQWFGTDGYEEMTSFALGLHQKLVNSGIDPRSDSYFEQIDARMKSVFRDFYGADDRSKSGDGSSRRPTTVVAPATRSTGARKVQLTETQLALARKFGLTPQQYAAQVAKLEKSNG